MIVFHKADGLRSNRLTVRAAWRQNGLPLATIRKFPAAGNTPKDVLAAGAQRRKIWTLTAPAGAARFAN
jgi:hypothetical protein